MDTLPARFWSKVRKTGGCWIWTAALNQKGYGIFWLDGRTHVAHRLSYEEAHGDIPPGLVTDHLCRNPQCVNPEHVEPVSNRQNLLRGSHINANRSHCKNGHPLPQEHSGDCMQCGRERSARYYEANKERVREQQRQYRRRTGR